MITVAKTITPNDHYLKVIASKQSLCKMIVPINHFLEINISNRSLSQVYSLQTITISQSAEIGNI